MGITVVVFYAPAFARRSGCLERPEREARSGLELKDGAKGNLDTVVAGVLFVKIGVGKVNEAHAEVPGERVVAVQDDTAASDQVEVEVGAIGRKTMLYGVLDTGMPIEIEGDWAIAEDPETETDIESDWKDVTLACGGASIGIDVGNKSTGVKGQSILPEPAFSIVEPVRMAFGALCPDGAAVVEVSDDCSFSRQA